MPKKLNTKKAAAAAIRGGDILEDAVAGKYEVAIVRGKLGFKGFRAEIVHGGKRAERSVYITSKVVAAQGRVERDTFLIVSGEEIQMVVAKQAQLDALRAAGRIPEEVSGLSEFFELEEVEEELETWDDPKSRARSNGERERMASEEKLAEEIAARIRKRRAGLILSAKRDAELAVRAAAEAAVRLAKLAEEAVEEDEGMPAEEAPAAKPVASAAPADRSAPNRAERRAARLAAEAEAAALAAEAARLEEIAERYRAAEEAELAAEEEAQQFAAAQARRPVPACWEDELDIDAI
jgi:hypothetical protein